MKTIQSLTMIFMVSALLIFSGCSKTNDEIAVAEPTDAHKLVEIGYEGSGVYGVTLFAGQSIDAGTVSFNDIDTDSDGAVDALEVVYNTTDGWELNEVHLFVGSSLADMPQTRNGSPKIGNFPHNFSDLGGITSYTIVIPFVDIDFTCPGPDAFFVAAHASVQKPDGNGGYDTETGWGDGERLKERGTWAMYFSIWITCDETNGPEEQYDTETAFAYGDTYAECFSELQDLVPNPNRWGWTNGTLSDGTYTFDIWAGAGQCDLTKGTLVGSLTIDYDAANDLVDVSYDLTGDFKLKEVHLYVGEDKLALNNQGLYTLAPGQYPHIETFNDLTTNSYSFNSISATGDEVNDQIYLVAHATVWVPVN